MRLVVIGGGPGGYTAAFEAAQRGIEVTLVEKERLGGTCLNHGCIPTKTLRASADALVTASRLAEYGLTGTAPGVDMPAVLARKNRVLDILGKGLEKTCAQLGVTLVHGTARLAPLSAPLPGEAAVLVETAEGTVTLPADAILLATGSRVQDLPGLVPDGQHVLDSDMALELDHVPTRLVIVGGGVIGCELAFIFRAFGSQVQIVEGQDRVLPIPGCDREVSALLAREMRKQKIGLRCAATLTDVRVEDGVVRGRVVASPFVPQARVREEDIEADMILVTVGRRANTADLGLAEAHVATDGRGWIVVDDRLATSQPGIYALGDVLGPGHVMLAHVAAMEGLCVVDNLLGAGEPMRYDVVPSAVFTQPEVGMVGLSEEQAGEAGLETVCATVQMRELGKSQAMGELAGFFKVVVERGSGRLLGVHIVGAHASDMVAEAALALRAGLGVHDVAATIHAHPTLAEGFWEACRKARALLQA